MDKDDALTRIEDEPVDALDCLARGRESLGVPCQESLAEAQRCILDALEGVARLHRGERTPRRSDGARREDLAA